MRGQGQLGTQQEQLRQQQLQHDAGLARLAAAAARYDRRGLGYDGLAIFEAHFTVPEFLALVADVLHVELRPEELEQLMVGHRGHSSLESAEAQVPPGEHVAVDGFKFQARFLRLCRRGLRPKRQPQSSEDLDDCLVQMLGVPGDERKNKHAIESAHHTVGVLEAKAAAATLSSVGALIGGSAASRQLSLAKEKAARARVRQAFQNDARQHVDRCSAEEAALAETEREAAAVLAGASAAEASGAAVEALLKVTRMGGASVTIACEPV